MSLIQMQSVYLVSYKVDQRLIDFSIHKGFVSAAIVIAIVLK